jgi:hypothetical protein
VYLYSIKFGSLYRTPDLFYSANTSPHDFCLQVPIMREQYSRYVLKGRKSCGEGEFEFALVVYCPTFRPNMFLDVFPFSRKVAQEALTTSRSLEASRSNPVGLPSLLPKD